MPSLRIHARSTLALLAAVACAAHATVASEEALPTARALASLRSVDALALSPDGRRIAYAMSEPRFDESAKPKDDDTSGGWKRVKRIWMVPAEGGAATPWTSEGTEASDPQWSPDGSCLAFVRKLDGKQRLSIMPVGGGEASVVNTGTLEPGEFAFAPDGGRIAFSAESPKTEAEKRADWEAGGAIQWGRQWRPMRLWVVPVAGGEPVQAYRGPEHVVAFRWSPDGKRFALLLADSADPYVASNLVRVAVAAADGSGEARWIETEPRNVEGLAWSPDGQFIAYQRAGRGLSLLDVLSVAEVDGPLRSNAAAKLDPTLAGFVWRPDSRSLIAHVIAKTDSKLYDFAFDGSRATDLGFAGRAIAGDIKIDRAGARLVFLSSTPFETASPTVFVIATKESSVAVDVNPDVEGWPRGTLEVVAWTNREGVRIEGTLFVCPDRKAGQPGPLLVMPHGGPDSVSTKSFSGLASFFMGRGYSVFRPNYRGSIGYGFDFYAANRGRMGAIEFMDIESGVDALIAQKRADPQRLFYGGWSWGGYLTAWTIGHTGRYRAAVAGAAVVDTTTQYVLSDINHGVAAAWEFKGDPWRQPESFARSNPLFSLVKVTTPTLILHGQADERVAFEQGRILYRALADMGCEVEFLAYPREPHGFREPAHEVHRYEAWAEWYRRHDPGAR